MPAPFLLNTPSDNFKARLRVLNFSEKENIFTKSFAAEGGNLFDSFELKADFVAEKLFYPETAAPARKTGILKSIWIKTPAFSLFPRQTLSKRFYAYQ
ncbi:MAG: hypothetical protein LBI02_07060 [Opitutaceae bacterium]|jgi:hypothetical protein|nr:hypothetical protein [Opitutaceae bacterium]